MTVIYGGGFMKDLKGSMKSTDSGASYTNFVACYACEPAAGTPADSRFVELFIENLRNYLQANNGQLKFPTCLDDISTYFP